MDYGFDIFVNIVDFGKFGCFNFNEWGFCKFC